MLKRIPIFWKLIAAYVIIIVFIMVAMGYMNGLIDERSATSAITGTSHWGRWTTARILGTVTAIIVAAALGFGATWFLVNRFIKRPVRNLVDGMNRLAEKEFDVRLDEDRKDEFGSLAVSFNDMASMLSSSLTELKKTRDYLDGILESSADIIITVNPAGKIRTFNAGAENALGYRRHDVIGKPIEMLFADPRDREVAISKLKYRDSVVNFETEFLTSSGAVRIVLLTLSRLRNYTGEIIGTIGISKDITEEKRLQEKLIQSERFIAIGQVFTGIQHSMKNMLNACTGGAYMVKTGLANDDRKMLEEGWDIVQEGISRMTDMSRDMLKYVKEYTPRCDRVDLAKILSEIRRVFAQTAQAKGVDFRLHVDPDLPTVGGDAGMIHSVIMDIVSNALDACLWKDYRHEETPEIQVRAYPDDDERQSVIEIKDNGCGMTDEVKANIFTPFFSTKSKAGTGLGLSIVARMIDVHGGKVDVESEPDRGTVFRIRLPINRTGQKQGEC